jgi:hypothetical protein
MIAAPGKGAAILWDRVLTKDKEGDSFLPVGHTD